MKDIQSSPVEPGGRLPWSDRFKWLNAYIFILCGIVMIYRTYRSPATWLVMLTGILFLVFGVYRLRLIRRVLDREHPLPMAREKGRVSSRF
ncbi:MAG: hypothetical protein LAO21_18865 [Acidobacteriia bacterium]|nr:hypothetical protein [Terriglobia bacterium]